MSEATTPSLSDINPLIVSNEWSEDTLNNIGDALMFLASAVPALALSDGFNRATANGVRALIEPVSLQWR